MIIRPLLLALTLLILPLSPATGQDWQAAIEVYKRGDYAKAEQLFRPFAEQGNATAQLALGLMYDNGKGGPQDHTEAVRWYRKAAEQGDAMAQYNLGVMYAKGEGVPQDHTEAVRWYRKAAEQGDAAAQANLGVMYYNGEGVPQDYVLAYAWLNLAAVGGNEKFKKGKEALRELMTAGQIARAQEMSTTLFNRINPPSE